MWPDGSFEFSSSAAWERRSRSFSRRFEPRRVAEAACDLGGALVAELCEPLQIFLQPFQHDRQIHDDCHYDITSGICQASRRHASDIGPETRSSA